MYISNEIFSIKKLKVRKSAKKVLKKGTVLISTVGFISIIMTGKAQALSTKKEVKAFDISDKYKISQIGKYTNPFIYTPFYISPEIEKIRHISRFNPKLFGADRSNNNDLLAGIKEKQKVKLFKRQKKI